MMKQKYDITGMTCSACALHVEKAVSKLPGTNKANVNLMQNTLQIDYDDKKTNFTDIKHAIEQAGYGIIDNTKDTDRSESNINKAIKEKKTNLSISIVLLLFLLYISMGSMLGLPLPSFMSGLHNAITYAMIQFLLTLVIMYLNRSYFINGFKALYHFTPTMDSLISIGASAAVIYGIYAILQMGIGLANQDFMLVEQYHMDLYFESAGSILTLISIGKYLEEKSKGKTSDAISKLMNLAPKIATVERNGDILDIDTDKVVKGDIVIVKTGNTIPVDGIIMEGEATINESALTGESMPVEKSINMQVSGGTISVAGYFKMKASRVGEDTTLSQIIKLVEEANYSKAPIAKLADKISAVFVPIVITVAVIATIIWLVMGYSLRFSLSIGIAILIISCPCALGLATPTAIMVGTGKGAEYGVLFKTAESLENLKHVNVVVLDKTGTVTEGKPIVSNIYPLESYNEKQLLQIAYNIEYVSEHPLALAINEAAIEQGLQVDPIHDFHQIAGQGITGKINDDTYLAGNKRMMEENDVNLHDIDALAVTFAQQGKTPLYFSKNNTLIGIIALQDPIKKNSREAIQMLQKQAIEVILLSGDNKETAQYIGSKVGISSIISDVLPQDKEQHIQTLMKEKKHVVMVGDGINDAPALARAEVGVAIGAGSDIAIDSADIVLMKSDLLDVVTAIQLSKATIRNIKQNLFWAFIYNIIGIPIATGLFYSPFHIKLNPMFGSIAMSLSSLFVVTNALRLRFFKPNTNIHKTNIGGNNKMEKIIHIEGMSCAHCEKRVNDALNAIDGVHAVVDLENNLANVNLTKEIANSTLKDAVENAGYTVTTIEDK